MALSAGADDHRRYTTKALRLRRREIRYAPGPRKWPRLPIRRRAPMPHPDPAPAPRPAVSAGTPKDGPRTKYCSLLAVWPTTPPLEAPGPVAKVGATRTA